MAEAFHHFAHFVFRVFVRWYTFLGTSPGGAAAQVVTLVITEAKGGWLRLSAWRTNWQGGLRRGAIALGSVWIVVFATCVVGTAYDDHMSLVAQVRGMTIERDQWKERSTTQEEQIKKFHNASAKIVTVQGPCKLTSEQINPARLPQPCPGAPPPTLRDKVLAINTNLTDGDRNRFSNALSEFDESLNEGQKIASRLNNESAISQGAKDVQSTEKVLTDIAAEGWKYQKSFPVLRNKWNMFGEQTEYIFGDNPDNEGPNALINAAEGYRNYLEWWNVIQNKDQSPIWNLLSVEQNEFNNRLSAFRNWHRGCVNRLTEMRNSIR